MCERAAGMHGYRPPSTEPRGKWATALHAKRKAEGLSQTEAFELLGPRLGLSPKSRSAYRALDQGERQPHDNEAAVLAEWLGYWPEDAEPVAAPTSDIAALVASLDALVAEMRLDREAAQAHQRDEIQRVVDLAMAPVWAEVRVAMQQREEPSPESATPAGRR